MKPKPRTSRLDREYDREVRRAELLIERKKQPKDPTVYVPDLNGMRPLERDGDEE